MSYFHYHILTGGFIKEVESPAYYSWLKTGLPLLELPFEEKIVDTRIHVIETYFCGVTTECIPLTPYHIEHSISQLEFNKEGVYLMPTLTRHLSFDKYEEMLFAFELLKRDMEHISC